MLLQHPEKMPLSPDVGKRGHRGKFIDVAREQDGSWRTAKAEI